MENVMRNRTDLSGMTEEEKLAHRQAKNREKARKWRAMHPEEHRRSVIDWQKKNPDKKRDSQRRVRAKNIEKYREYNARWHRENRANNPMRVRAMHLKSLYGITLEQYDEMLAKQEGHCAACPQTPEKEHHKVLHVDHNHVTGAVRGLLCGRCNTALGLMRENPTGLTSYLQALANP
jgi:hypothetical protein